MFSIQEIKIRYGEIGALTTEAKDLLMSEKILLVQNKIIQIGLK